MHLVRQLVGVLAHGKHLRVLQPGQPYLQSLYKLSVVQDKEVQLPTKKHVFLLLHLHDPEGHPLASFCHWKAVLTCQTVTAVAVISSIKTNLKTM